MREKDLDQDLNVYYLRNIFLLSPILSRVDDQGEVLQMGLRNVVMLAYI